MNMITGEQTEPRQLWSSVLVFLILCPELKNGVLVLSINHGSGTLTLQLPPTSSVTDRRWHRLDISTDGKVGLVVGKRQHRWFHSV